MPRGDGTGPRGAGPGTGRKMGGSGQGRGFCGAGFPGRVPFWGYYGSYEPAVNEKEFLKKEAEFLEKELEQIKKLLASSKEDEEI